ncbi:MAG: serine/threonine protein kinase, partial [Microbacterium sp.]
MVNPQNSASFDASIFDASPFDTTPFDTIPVFADTELVENQRWSTWPAITPTERGPLPWPDWVVTSAAAVDTELGILKTGKEADVFLIERAVPGDPTQRTLLAAKRYRDSEHRGFQRSSTYTEGRRTRSTRDTRA